MLKRPFGETMKPQEDPQYSSVPSVLFVLCISAGNCDPAVPAAPSGHID